MHHTIAFLPVRFDNNAEVVEHGLKRHFFQMFVCTRIDFQPSDPLQALDQSRESLKVFILPVTVFLILVVSVETFYVRPGFFTGMTERPAAWIALIFVAGGLAAVITGPRSGAERRTFLGGCVFIAGLLPHREPISGDPYSTVSGEYSITAYNGLSDASSLRAATYWGPWRSIELSLFRIRRQPLPRPCANGRLWARSTIEGCLSPIKWS